MQYKIMLPKDYDMEIIQKRVNDNGHKTDGFPGLQFKAYLISKAGEDGNDTNSYSPLYVWKTAQGMNKFIFEGYYDNILASFGWQHINIGVPFSIELTKDFHKSRYAVEYAGNIPERESLTSPHFNKVDHFVKDADHNVGSLLVYNPDKWGYSEFKFYLEKPQIDSLNHVRVYEILHVSEE